MERHYEPDYLLRSPGTLPTQLRQNSTPIHNIGDFDPLMDYIGDSRIVMLGEATHGTSEFYTWRAKLSQRLIEEKGFNFIAVEGDWPPCYMLNRFIKDYDGADTQALDVVQQFQRWPTWMWANWEVVAFIDSLKRLNTDLSAEEKVGFYGLDVYSLSESIAAVIGFLEEHDSGGLEMAQRALQCFEPHGLRGSDYAHATALVGANCRDEVIDLLRHMQSNFPVHDGDFEEELSARQNTRVLVNAEEYYRTMVRGGPQSWNLRDRHMARTLDDLLEFHGPQSRAIVWEHNTHIGDARFTDMHANGMTNIGHIGRRDYGRDTVLVGFGSHRGTVIAGTSWGAPMEEMELPPAASGSWEDIFHRAGEEDRLLIMEEVEDLQEFSQPIGHRAVGVVYRPEYDDPSNYVPSIMPMRYDAFVFIDKSQALHPLHIQPKPYTIPETFPFGV